ncbi:hypothetical protein Q644_16860 [Brucella intermedia 229E]|uniref:NADPH-dependent FMN reductase n=1 Tax=Brucella intermedia 229E TaxID=1337887 RepID=U4VHW4_9HYPH|nr:hypothetical protein Q644_16860 [Brucella intermedia 229E]
MWTPVLTDMEDKLDDFPHLAEAAKNMLDQLIWWGGKALKVARG